MSRMRPTPESDELAAVRREYDGEIYQLRVEIAGLRKSGGLSWVGISGLMLTAFILGVAAGFWVSVVTG